MQCYSPIKLKSMDVVPCGRCPACLSNRRSDWFVRMKVQMKTAIKPKFITLTYDEINVPYNDVGMTLVKEDIQKFIKRLRKNSGKGLKYYCVGEYGGKFKRPHYHIIIFNLVPIDDGKLQEEIVSDAWKKGSIHFGEVTDASINYVTSYIINPVKEYTGIQKPFSLMSKGIGKNYIEDYKEHHKGDINRMCIVEENGKSRPLPRYYKDKLYNESEKRKYSIKCQLKAIKKYEQNKQKKGVYNIEKQIIEKQKEGIRKQNRRLKDKSVDIKLNKKIINRSDNTDLNNYTNEFSNF